MHGLLTTKTTKKKNNQSVPLSNCNLLISKRKIFHFSLLVFHSLPTTVLLQNCKKFWAKTPYNVPRGTDIWFISVNTNSDCSFGALINSLGQVNASIGDAVGYKSLYRWDNYTWNSNELHHFAFVYNNAGGVNKYIRFYCKTEK